jgi:hypothetical protein
MPSAIKGQISDMLFSPTISFLDGDIDPKFLPPKPLI